MKKRFSLTIMCVILLMTAGKVWAADWIVGSGGDAWTGNVSFEDTYIPYENVELKNGYNPANLFVSPTSSYVNDKINATNKKIGIRFTAQESKTVTAICINHAWAEYTPQATYRCGLQADVSGNPSGSWLGSNTFTPIGTDTSYTITLESSVALTKNSVYHIIIQYESGTVTSTNCISTFTVNAQNTFYPKNKGADSNINSKSDTNLMHRYYDGSTWVDKDTFTPPFLLNGLLKTIFSSENFNFCF